MSNHGSIADAIAAVLVEATGDDQFWSPTELVRRAGVPTRYAHELSRATMTMTTEEQAQALAADYAERIARDLDRADDKTPTELAAELAPW